VNIFFLDYDPVKCAEYMVDSHVSKMILETAQLLSTAHHVHNSPTAKYMYKPTHVHHPSAVWTQRSVINYKWLVNHFHGLAGEFSHRFGGRTHKSYDELVDVLCEPPRGCMGYELTVPKPAMDDEYILYKGVDWHSVVLSYRNYYKWAKRDLHKWTGRPRPEFC
jgi:hypothetical protein